MNTDVVLKDGQKVYEINRWGGVKLMFILKVIKQEKNEANVTIATKGGNCTYEYPRKLIKSNLCFTEEEALAEGLAKFKNHKATHIRKIEARIKNDSEILASLKNETYDYVVAE